MQHQFRTPEGPVEVTVAKQGDVWHLGEHRATVEPDGRLRIQLASGGSALATVAKVGDTWWIHFEGHTFCLERIEPGASQSGEERWPHRSNAWQSTRCACSSRSNSRSRSNFDGTGSNENGAQDSCINLRPYYGNTFYNR